MTRLHMLLLWGMVAAMAFSQPGAVAEPAGAGSFTASGNKNYLTLHPEPLTAVATPTATVEWFEMGEYTVSFYTRSVEEGTAWGITRSGQELRPGFLSVAVLNDKARTPVIDLGKTVYVEGLGYAEVADTGGGLCETCIDWYLEGTRAEAFERGLVKARMWIVQNSKKGQPA